jgi:hypothetical protein
LRRTIEEKGEKEKGEKEKRRKGEREKRRKGEREKIPCPLTEKM